MSILEALAHRKNAVIALTHAYLLPLERCPHVKTLPWGCIFAVSFLTALAFPSGLFSQGDWQFLGLQEDKSTCCLRFLTVSPHDSRSLVAGLDGIVSEDGGDSWSFIERRPAPSLQGLTISRTNPDLHFRWTSSATERSLDGGRTWVRMAPLPRYQGEVVANPDDPNSVYVWSRNSLERSTDAGFTWAKLPAEPRFGLVATGPSRLLWIELSGLLLSLDNGDTSAEILPNIRLLAQDPADPLRLVALQLNGRGSTATRQLLHSEDGGESWALGLVPPSRVPAIEGLAINGGGTIFMTTQTGFWRFPSDGSFAETELPNGIGNPHRIFPTATEPGRLYGLFNGSPHRSDDGGKSFYQIYSPKRP